METLKSVVKGLVAFVAFLILALLPWVDRDWLSRPVLLGFGLSFFVAGYLLALFDHRQRRLKSETSRAKEPKVEGTEGRTDVRTREAFGIGIRTPVAWLWLGSLYLAIGLVAKPDTELVDARGSLLESIHAELRKQHQELLGEIRSQPPVEASPNDYSKPGPTTSIPLDAIGDLQKSIDALRKTPTVIQQVHGENHWHWKTVLLYLTPGILFLVVTGSFSSIYRSEKAVRIGTLIGMSSLLSLGGLTLKGLRLVYSAQDQVPMVVVLPEEPVVAGAGPSFASINHGAVGPFQSGEAKKLDLKGEESLARLVEKLENESKGKELLLLIVVGSTDITPLRSDRAETYESNTGLAAARAEWVREQLSESYPEKRIVATIRGGHGSNRDGDRIVIVYGLWKETRVEAEATPVRTGR